jgi:hypothetical protein
MIYIDLASFRLVIAAQNVMRNQQAIRPLSQEKLPWIFCCIEIRDRRQGTKSSWLQQDLQGA